MRALPLLAALAALSAVPPGAAAQSITGGSAPPSASGGAEYGVPAKKSKRPARSLRATHFAIRPGTLTPGGRPARISYKVKGPARRVRVRVELLAPGARSATVRIRLGWKRTGERRVNRWKPPSTGLPPGEYTARLHAVDDRGRVLTRTATASGRSSVLVEKVEPVVVAGGIFPIQGEWEWGGKGGEFGSDRGSHIHQGQDLTAPEGTPVVTPVAGSVLRKAYQSKGAGHYVVIHGDDGRDLVFMHLVSGSIPVRTGDPVSAGQTIGAVGSTGRSSGPHLHFEIWPCGWYAKGCEPIDPRPDLEAWAGSTAAPA